MVTIYKTVQKRIIWFLITGSTVIGKNTDFEATYDNYPLNPWISLNIERFLCRNSNLRRHPLKVCDGEDNADSSSCIRESKWAH